MNIGLFSKVECIDGNITIHSKFIFRASRKYIVVKPDVQLFRSTT